MPIHNLHEIKYLFNPAIAVPLAGKLKDVPLPRVFNYLRKNSYNGIISIAKEDGERKIISFDKGVPKFVISNIVEECLGKRFVSQGRMTQEQCDKSLQMMRKHKKKQGEVLVQMGLFEPYEIDEALKEQAKERLFDLFSWTQAEYSFSSKKKLRKDLVPLDISLPRIVLMGVRRYYDIRFLRKFLDPFLDCSPFIDDGETFGLEDFSLATWESKAARHMSGGSKLRDILNKKVAREIDIYHLVFSLGVLETLKFYDTETTKERLKKKQKETVELERAIRRKKERRQQQIIELTKDFVVNGEKQRSKKKANWNYYLAAVIVFVVLIVGAVLFFSGNNDPLSKYYDPAIVKSVDMDEGLLIITCKESWNPGRKKEITRQFLSGIFPKLMKEGIGKMRLKSANGDILGHALSKDLETFVIDVK